MGKGSRLGCLAGAKTAELVGGKVTDDGRLEFYCEWGFNGTWPATNISVRCDQIPEMMKHVREYGVQHHDKEFGVTFFVEDSKAESKTP